MRDELTDLLPESRRVAVLREYRLRIAVVAVVLFTVLVVIANVLLVPAYLLLMRNVDTSMANLAASRSSAATAEEKTLSTTLSTLSGEAHRLISVSEQPSVSKTVATVLAVPRTGVTLAGLVYRQEKGSSATTLELTGTAATRDDLRNYQLALQGVPFVKTADLPVSAYANDTDILFTITLTLSL